MNIMKEQYSRAELVYGKEKLEKIRSLRIAVFGIGGVGGNAVEALARSGVGALDLIDNDTFCESNLNRQLFALRSTLGMYKTQAAKERIHDIDPDICVNTMNVFYLPETAGQFDFNQYDYVIDAIDTVTGKLMLIEEAARCNVPIISAMGCGNRIDPSKLVVTDIYKTSEDPLSRVMRRELKKRNIKKLKVVYSTEHPVKTTDVPGSTAFVPAAAGIMLAAAALCDLLKEE